MGTMASQITSLTIVYSTVYSGTGQRNHQSSASLTFVQRIHRWPVNSLHKGTVTRKMFPFDDVIMVTASSQFCETKMQIYLSTFPEIYSVQQWINKRFKVISQRKNNVESICCFCKYMQIDLSNWIVLIQCPGFTPCHWDVARKHIYGRNWANTRKAKWNICPVIFHNMST